MLNAIYLLLPQDITDFKALNALPENNQGPQVSPMSYRNDNDKSSVLVNLTGTAGTTIPSGGLLFSTTPSTAVWITVGNLVTIKDQLQVELGEDKIPTPVVLDANGDGLGVYCESISPGSISADFNTLNNIIIPVAGVNNVVNPFNAVVSGEDFLNCVDKKTIDDPTYQPWADAMEANQAIGTREVIIITIGM